MEALGESLQIPESHNGVPDLIDETAYELDWLAKAVLNTKEGTLPFFLRPASGGYEQGAPPEGQPKRVFFTVTKGPNRAETLFAAGALAMGARSPLFKKYLPARCALYRKAALRAFAGYLAHAADKSYWKDFGWYDTDAKPHKWSDEMLVAAANLFSLTGDAKYLEYVRAELPPDLKKSRRWGWLADVPSLLAFVTLARTADPRLDPAIARAAREAVIDFADASLGHDNRRYEAPFGAPLPWTINQRVGWYFTGSANAWPLMIGYAFTHEARYLEQLTADWNWLLGTNPLSRTFVSGLGDPEHRPRWPVNEIAQVEWAKWQAGDKSGWVEIQPGFLSADVQGGAYSWFLKDAHNAARRDEKFPAQDANYPALYRYHDSWTVEDEATIERLARSAVSVLPLVQLQRPPVRTSP